MDTENRKFILDYLGKLGFDAEESLLYLTLSEKGALTMLEASRASGIDRAKLYRSVGNLVKKGLIEEIPEFNHRKIRATDLMTIDMILKQRELEQKALVNSFPTFLETMKSLTHPSSESKVVYYRGKEGIKQLVWNILRSNDEYHRCTSYSYFNQILDEAFILRLNATMLEKKFKVHDIYSDQYLDYQKEWLRKGLGKPQGVWDFWDSRYISEDIVTINLNIDIYNDVVAYYYWQDNEIFGVEVYNERVAKFQKQMFDVLWKMTKKRPELDWGTGNKKHFPSKLASQSLIVL